MKSLKRDILEKIYNQSLAIDDVSEKLNHLSSTTKLRVENNEFSEREKVFSRIWTTIEKQEVKEVCSDYLIIGTPNQFEKVSSNVFELESSKVKEIKKTLNAAFEKNENFGIVFDLQHCNIDLESDLFIMLYEIVKDVMVQGSKTPLKILVLAPLDLKSDQDVFSSSLYSFFNAIQSESSFIDLKFVLTDGSFANEDLLEKELHTKFFAYPNLFKYENSAKSQSLIAESKIQQKDFKVKENLHFVISGGLSGIGYQFAKYLCYNFNAKVSLLGRRSISKDLQIKLDNLGTQAQYFSVDITDQVSLKKTLDLARSEFGPIGGVIHSAGVLKDALLKKSNFKDGFLVCEPKILGIQNLDKATHLDPLEYFLCFSSGASAFANPGQSFYSLANEYCNQWIKRRSRKNEKKGISKSFLWPMWDEGGMDISEQIKKDFARKIGMEIITIEDGIRFFQNIFLYQETSLIYLKGDQKKIQNVLNLGFDPSRDEGLVSKKENSKAASFDLAKKYLMNLMVEILEWDSTDIDFEENLDELGIDSIIISSVNEKLEQDFPGISKTIFFEYENLNTIAEYFEKEYSKELQSIYEIVLEKPEIDFSDIVLDSYDVIEPVEKEDIVSSASSEKNDIAIIGMNGRYPEAKNHDELWRVLVEKKDCIKEIPKDYWHQDDANPPKRFGGFIDGVKDFDPLFFNIPPSEASLLDPQERLLLQSSWHTIEDAGYSRKDLDGKKIGVFFGAMYSQYQLFASQESVLGNSIYTNSSFASFANRVSFVFNWKGPSLTLDTMCSSSLTALHMACDAIRNGDCESALIGGVNITIHPQKHKVLIANEFLSKDGRCRSFGKGGSGYVPSESVGTMLLKPLHKAKEDGDQILAVIKGSGINQCGKGAGYTAPSSKAQGELLTDVYKKFQIEKETISYIEAHGTGTPLGDPIEINGIKNGLGSDLTKQSNCAIGSIKSNIGHAESASGMAGLSKVVLQLKNKQIVPNLHSRELNPELNLKGAGLYVPQENEKWLPRLTTSGKQVWRAGINSFGAGGTNVHVVLENAPVEIDEKESFEKRPNLFSLSAKTKEVLISYASLYENELEKNSYDLNSLSYTLLNGREDFNHRLIFEYKNQNDILTTLKEFRNSNVGNYHYHEVKKGQKNSVSLDTSDIEILMPSWIEKRNFGKLASLWVEGVKIPWAQFYSVKPKKISLPGYPFQRRECWIPTLQTRYQELPSFQGEKKEEKVYESLLYKSWKIARKQPKAIDSIERKGVILVDTVSEEFLEALRRQFPEAILISKFDVLDFENRILNHLSDFSFVLDLIDYQDLDSDENWSITQARVSLLQGIVKASTSPLKYFHLTQNLSSYRSEKVNLRGSLYQGAQRVAEFEEENFQPIWIDCKENDYSSIAKLVNYVFDSSIKNQGEFLYKDKVIWIPKYLSVSSERETPNNKVIKPDSWYVILGGTGAIGKEICRNIIQNGATKVLILGHTALPDLRSSPSQLSKSASQKFDFLKNLQESGIEVSYYYGEIEEASLNHYLKNENILVENVRGVVHSGLGKFFDFNSFATKTHENINQALLLKTKGTLELIKCFDHGQLDFFVCFSSVASFIPSTSKGMSHYSMANRYQEDLCFQKNKEGKSYYKVLNWVFYGDAGVRANKTEIKKMKDLGLYPTNKTDGLRYFEQCMSGKEIQILAGSLTEKVLKDLGVEEKHFGSQKEITEVIEEKFEEVIIPSNRLDSSSNGLVSQLRDLFCSTLQMKTEEFELDTTFDEYGVDSIVVSDIVVEINKKFSVEITPVFILESATINKLALALEEELNVSTDFETALPAEPKLSVLEEKPEKTTVQIIRKPEEKLKRERLSGKVAIIGMGGQFPDAENVTEFWENILDKKDSIREIPKDRFDYEGFYSLSGEPGKSKSKWGGFLNDIKSFDHKYFKINEDHAIQLDPLVRKLLEGSIHTLDDSGYNSKEIAGKNVGVFVGSRASSYASHIKEINKYSLLGIGQNFIATQLSQFLDLKGPSLVIDTACSSSLVSVHQACQSLLSGDCEMAFAGGVDLLLEERFYLALEQIKALSAQGKCYSFDQRADGFVLGEGVGMLLLKPLEKAIEEGDQIHAVIDASSVNNDGYTMGMTPPSFKSQKAVIEKSLEKAEILNANIELVESHGIGSPLGDAIEIKALKEVFVANKAEKNSCALGSVKSNIGHLMSAAGVAAMVKTIFSLREAIIPPTLHCETPNPLFHMDDSPFYLSSEGKNWESDFPIRRALVNSFGIGGTNANVMLSSYDLKVDEQYQCKRKPFPLTEFDKKEFWLEKKNDTENPKLKVAPKKKKSTLKLTRVKKAELK